MFTENKYKTWYDKIVGEARVRIRITGEIYEKHHIIPKSLGGGNEKSNLVHLTHREHFTCHRLLVKMTEGEDKRRMSYALWMMASCKRVVTAHQYALAKRALVETGRQIKHTDEFKANMSKRHKGKIVTAETRAKIGAKTLSRDRMFGRYELSYSNGSVIEVIDLQTFCKNNKMNYSTLSQLANGTYKHKSKLDFTIKKTGYVLVPRNH